MSMKIYHGFRFVPTEWDEINQVVLEIREQMKPFVIDILQKMADVMADDRRAKGLKVDSTEIKSKLSDGLRKSAIGDRRSALDFTSTICVYPFEGRVCQQHGCRRHGLV